VPYEKIEVVIHPQSLIHSAIEFVDGSVIAQIGNHDMRLPIQYALSYPRRLPNKLPKFSFFEAKQFTFDKPDFETFSCLSYAIEAGKKGGTICTAMNSANDAAVFAFLAGKIKFMQIPETIRKVMDWHEPNNIKNPKVEDVLQVNNEARAKALEILGLEKVEYKK
jgi:1-deoxy-D-xylulose-5-phosphate reductoisomerase